MVLTWIKLDLYFLAVGPFRLSNSWNDYLWITPVSNVRHRLSQCALPVVPKIPRTSNRRGSTDAVALPYAVTKEYHQMLQCTLVSSPLPNLPPQLSTLVL